MSRKPGPCPPLARLHEVLRRDGDRLIWRFRAERDAIDIRWNRNFADQVAGAGGRIEIDGQKFLTRRVFFKMVTGEDAPAGMTAPPAEVQTGIEPGDIWAIGPHRLMCGDAADPRAVAKLMNGRSATLCFTSPPYADQRDYGGPKRDWDTLMADVFGDLPMTADGQVLVNLGVIHRDNEVWGYADGWIAWMRAHGWRHFSAYVWDQGWGLPGHWVGRREPAHEMIHHFNRSPRGTPSRSERAHKIPDSVIRIGRDTSRNTAAHQHPARFPVALGVYMIEAFSDPADVVYEPFAGSGTMIVAAQQTGRACYAIELNPNFCKIALQRITQETGLNPVKIERPNPAKPAPIPAPAIVRAIVPEIHQGDMLTVLDSFAENSIDAVVTDPPYFLQSSGRPVASHMGQYRWTQLRLRNHGSWDSDVAFSAATWKKVLRVMKPGAHLLAFAAAKHQHKVASALAAAGFEIRDMLIWAYASGLPSGNVDVAKAIDAELEYGGSQPSHRRMANKKRTRSAEGEQWEGFHSRLKSAIEPIILARKPLSERSLAKNILRWGVGALNIDACRINPGPVTGNYPDPEMRATVETKGRWPTPLFLADEALAGDFQHLFWAAKVGPEERAGSDHPTLKPLSLIREFVRLVAPPGGVVLDPFAGSGTTGEAALLEGMRPILIEREPVYIAGTRRRLRNWLVEAQDEAAD